MHKFFCTLLGLILIIPLHATAAVIIQSVEPGSPAASDEYITLFNPENTQQDLSGWSVQVKSDTSTTVQKKNFAAGMSIPPRTSVFVANNSGIYATKALMTYASFSLPEGGATIVVAPTTTILASFPNGPNAISYHYDLSKTTSSSTTTTLTSPTNTNIISAAPDVFVSHNEPPPYAVQLSELFPNPAAHQNEFIELYNPNPVAISLAGYTLQDASGNSYILGTRGENTTIMPQEYRAWSRNITNIALNDTGGEQVSLLTPRRVLVDEITYSGDAPRNAGYAQIRGGWHWTQSPTPNAPNAFDELPEPPIARAEIPGGPFFVGDQIICSATDTTDPNNDIQKYYWNFGDGFEADEIITSHTYATSGTYSIYFTVFDAKGASSTVARTIIIKEKNLPTIASSSTTMLTAAAHIETEKPYATNTITKEPRDAAQHATTYSGIVTIAPGVLGPLTMVVGTRTVIFTTPRAMLEKIKPGSLVTFSAHEKFRNKRLILTIQKTDQFRITGGTNQISSTTLEGVITETTADYITLQTSSTPIMLPKKETSFIPPSVHVGDVLRMNGVLLTDDAATPFFIPTEKLVVTKVANTNSTLHGFLMLYGSGALLLFLYFVLTKKRAMWIIHAVQLLLRGRKKQELQKL